MAASRMNCIPLLFLLLLSFHLQGTASRCIDISFEQELQPLPPGVERCSLPEGLLRPDILPPGPEGSSAERGDSRIVGGSPAMSEGYGGGPSTAGSPFQLGKPGGPTGPLFGGGPRDPIPGGPGPVRVGRPGGLGAAGQDDGGPRGFSIRYNTPGGYPRPVWKAPGIPYIPSHEEKGGPYTPISRGSPLYRPKAPYAIPYGGGAGSYNSGREYSSSAYGGGSIASGPRGREDGSYGPIPVPEAVQPGGPPITPCIPNC